MKKTFKKLYQIHQGKITDKWTLYLDEWERLFESYRDLQINLLEIGIQNGGSLEIWSSYFQKARKFIGCDIDPNCKQLRFDDARIAVIVGDANSDDCEREILQQSPSFDIVIDDGSHRSIDIVRTFARYFPWLNDNGIYLVEDLHSSYWENFGGGLNDPFSAMSFFKRLTDIINQEHWRNNKNRVDLLGNYSKEFGIMFDEFDLTRIHSIEFVNSLCIIKKLPPDKNVLGKRIIAGTVETVTKGWEKLNGTLIQDVGIDIKNDSNLDVFELIATIQRLNKQVVELEQAVRTLSAQAEESEQIVQGQTILVGQREQELETLTSQMAEREQELETLTSQMAEREQELQTLTSQIADREQALSAQLLGKDQFIQVLKVQAAEREKILNVLADQYREITISKSWRAALLFRRMRVYLLPPGSLGMRLARKTLPLLLIPFKLRRIYQRNQDIRLVRKSGLFDSSWYLANYRDVAQAGVDPLSHYIRFGASEGRDPSHDFSSSQYLSVYSDVQKTGMNPLVHYIKFGKKEGRSPIPKENSKASDTNRLLFYRPKVTIVVPNYNHATYLEKRLTSIYQQSYKNYEVILLDDFSSDQSRKILLAYQNLYPEITRCIFNDTNSGSAFSQWKKGIENAEGELIWIAESDDYCDLDFLEKLIPLFFDETILLSYAHSIFVDENEQRHVFAFEHYLSDIDQHKWDSSYIASAHDEVNSCLGLKNSIPNVSSVVFRRPKGIVPILNDPYWLKMKVCGDWLFYLNFIRGGRIAYCRETHNYYRIYQTSSSKKTHVQDIYYQEHETVACAIASLYDVPDELLLKNYQLLEKFYLETVKKSDIRKFNILFNLEKVRQCKSKRTPNILMGVFAFSFGGGEIFPIRLANVLKEKGSSVILFNGNFEPIHPEVRKMLYPQIPVINNNPSIDLNGLVKEYGIEITHTHHANMDRMFSGVLNSKHVTTMHGMYEMMGDFLENTKDYLSKIDHWFFTTPKNIVPFQKNNLYDPVRFTKIDNGMCIPDIHKVDLDQFGITNNSFTICLATRALYDKGWFEAIESIAIARKSTKKDIHLLLIGEGPVYEILKNTSLPNYIHLLGYRSNLVDYFSASCLGFLPSYFKGESFPLVIIECFMAEKPIIATKIGEIPNMMITDDQRIGGALVDLRKGKVNPNDLALALTNLINDEKYYQECVNVVKVLKNKFDLNKIADKYLDIYNKVI